MEALTMWSSIVYIWINIIIVKANFTFSYNMAMRCKEHLCQHGYSYETFYRVDSPERRRLNTDVDIEFEMHIAILAASNGHILLSPVEKPESTDPVYEIVVGGGGNKFTELRRNLRRNARSSAKTVGILSSVEFRAFYIKISEEGLIEFGKEGEPLPLLSYYDINPLPIRYFSFAAWNGVEAKFLYDCPAPGKNDSKTTSTAVEPKLSNSEYLKRTLLSGRQPALPPGISVTVKLGVRVTTVSYDAMDSKLYTQLALVTSWTDDSMAWNPNKFNGTTSLRFRQGQIWKPTFFVFNSESIREMDNKNPDLISMVYSGEATFHFQTRLSTWCTDYSNTLNKWPHDQYRCVIIIGPWEIHEKISLEQISFNDIKMKTFSNIDEEIESQWELTYKQNIVSWNDLFSIKDNETYQSDRYVINVTLKRKATSLNIIFYTPLLTLLAFVLMSFWSEPLQPSRMRFYAGTTVVICMGLCYVDYLIPCHTVPSILVLYTTILMSVVLALIVQVILMTSFMRRLCKAPFVQTIITAKIFRAVFCLPPLKTCKNYVSINEGYSQDDDDSGVIIAPRNGNIEEMETDGYTLNEIMELAVAIDKLMFFIYSLVFAVMFACHF